MQGASSHTLWILANHLLAEVGITLLHSFLSAAAGMGQPE